MAELATEPTLGAVIATLVRVHRRRVGHGRLRPFRRHPLVPRAGTSPRRVASPSTTPRRAPCSRASRRPARSGRRVLGHNDLLNANFLDDGSIRILDWEYAGMADPYFDLANFSVNNELGSRARRADPRALLRERRRLQARRARADEARLGAARGDVGRGAARHLRARRRLRRLRRPSAASVSRRCWRRWSSAGCSTQAAAAELRADAAGLGARRGRSPGRRAARRRPRRRRNARRCRPRRAAPARPRSRAGRRRRSSGRRCSRSRRS